VFRKKNHCLFSEPWTLTKREKKSKIQPMDMKFFRCTRGKTKGTELEMKFLEPEFKFSYIKRMDNQGTEKSIKIKNEKKET
jgi:hypothetical protein